jgi:PAS domain S-box-containing protein
MEPEPIGRRQGPLAAREHPTGAPVHGGPSLGPRGPDLEDLVESVTDPYVLGDPVRDATGRIVDFRIRAVNGAACRSVRIPRRQVVGALSSALFPHDFGTRLLRMLVQVIETGDPLSVDEYPYPTPWAGGDLHRYDVRATAVNGRVVFTWRDVTDRYEERRRYESMIANSADVVLLVRGGGIEWVSPGVTELLGWTVDEVTGLPGDQIVHPADRHRLVGGGTGNGAARRTRERMRYLKKDGGSVWCEARAVPVPEETGPAMVVSLRDMTGAMAVEADRDHAAALYRLVAENASDVVYTTDRMYRFNWVSPSVEAVLGWTADELVGRPTSSIQAPEHQELVWSLRSRIYGAGETIGPQNLRYRTKSGGWRWMSARAHPVPDDVTGRQGVVVSLRDAEYEVLERRATDTLTAGSALLAVAEDETALLEAMCETAVRVGGYAFAWYGWCEAHDGRDGSMAVVPVSSSTGGRARLGAIVLGPEGADRTGRPSGRAAWTGMPVVEPDLGVGADSAPWRAEAVASGLRSSASLPVRVGGRTDGVFTVYASEHHAFDDHTVAVLEDLTRTLGYGIERLRDRDDLHVAFASSIDLVAAVVESRDPYTAGHQAHVAELARAIGAALGLPDHRLDGLTFAARIHDVGKIGVPIDILCRPGVLDREEVAVVRRHATIGWEIAGHFAWPWPVAEIIHQHHERFDGSGYPAGRRGDEILLESRIVSVADTYEAMASRRPYRESLGEEAAHDAVVAGSGTQFDPVVVAAFVRVMADGFTFSTPEPGQV